MGPALNGIVLRWVVAGALVLAAAATAAVVIAWTTQQRLRALEAELVRRQQDSGNAASEARLLSRRAEEAAREVTAKVAMLEARVAETAMQRSQFEDLIQSLARSRDENVLADAEAAIRVALQQTAITGSAEPLLAALRQTDERLARYNQPRLERVRRAVLQDLERARSAAGADIATLTLRLDDVIRQVDDLPLLAAPERRGAATTAARPAASVVPNAPASLPASAAASQPATGWADAIGSHWSLIADRLWQEVKGLVRVTRIDVPEAMLVAPEQAFFLRENLKLRLLNARLALLSRQFETAQYDLRDAQSALDRYFDRTSRRTVVAAETLRQVAAQARTVAVPRPDATLAAIAAAAAGR
jgi:uroporphyrin-3 C-methyltransferase